MPTMTLWNTAAVSLAIAALAIAAPGIDAETLRKPSGPVPWAIDTRPMPQGTNLQALLPRRIGDFTRDEARRSGVSLRGEKRSVGTEPSYFTAGDFASWSRDRYFFFAKASAPETLDRFMRSFPF